MLAVRRAQRNVVHDDEALAGYILEKSRTVQRVNTQNKILRQPILSQPDGMQLGAVDRGWGYRFSGGCSKS